MKILVAADGSAYTQRMLDYLATHDEWLGKAHDYVVVHCVPAVPSRAAAALDKSMLDDYYHDEAEKVLEPLRRFFEEKGLRAQFLGRVGHAAEIVAKLANEGGFDLLLMGAHGHTSLGGLVMGSVTTNVLAHCGTPVLLIR